MTKNIPRSEYPRPDFMRMLWMNLNGEWEFVFDDSEVGEKRGWFLPECGMVYDRKIIVPFCYQSKQSGINDTSYHKNMWYRKTFRIPISFCGKRILLRFGAIDEFCKVWLNGNYVGCHRGGYSSFLFDITNHVCSEDNTIVVMAEDDFSIEKPRGKQYWKESPESIWYTPTSGIWQTVWLEAVNEQYIESFNFYPCIDQRAIRMDMHLRNHSLQVTDSLILHIEVSFQQSFVTSLDMILKNLFVTSLIDLTENDFEGVHLWSPESPNLYDISLVLKDHDGKELDHVTTYYGVREISTNNGMVLLNRKPYWQRLILDQGYWPESLLTPPTDEAIKRDILSAKELGFNGARKHQKIEDPRFYYWADVLGFLVWGEMPSTYCFSKKAVTYMMDEWREFLQRDFNHPSIVCWVPFNESWGVECVLSNSEQQNFVRSIYYYTKSVDPTRLISSNDGWEQVKPSDLCAIHDYTADQDRIINKYSNLEELMKGDAQGRLLYADGNQYEGEPILITEYGGIAFSGASEKEWGYSGFVNNEEEFLMRFRMQTEAFCRIRNLCGYCYTQLTDVEQEINGLLTADRRYKVSAKLIREVIN